MRGKGVVHILVPEPLGITPACAGKSAMQASKEKIDKDHPRMCGEKALRALRLTERLGSPPHVRGKGILAKSTDWQYRITPACAGKSV